MGASRGQPESAVGGTQAVREVSQRKPSLQPFGAHSAGSSSQASHDATTVGTTSAPQVTLAPPLPSAGRIEPTEIGPLGAHDDAARSASAPIVRHGLALTAARPRARSRPGGRKS